MEIPQSLLENTIEENKIYFFTDKSKFGVKGHLHVCLRKGDEILLFSTCTSQMDTVYKLARYRGFDLNTFPCIKKNDTNLFDMDYTYINCNQVWTYTIDDFVSELRNGRIIPTEGFLSDAEMQTIASGVQKSQLVPLNIKKLFINK